MNTIIENALKNGEIVKTIYLEAILSKEGRRLRQIDEWEAHFLGKSAVIEVRIFKGMQPVIRLCDGWVEPELLRQLLIWAEKGEAPGLIIKDFKDVMGMDVT